MGSTPRLQCWRLGTLPRSASLPGFCGRRDFSFYSQFYSTLFGLAHAQPSVRPRLVQAASRRFGVCLGHGPFAPSLPRLAALAGGILALAVFTSSLDLAQKVAAALDSASVACCERRADLPNSQFSARSSGLRSCRCCFGAGLGFLTGKILCSEKNPLGKGSTTLRKFADVLAELLHVCLKRLRDQLRSCLLQEGSGFCRPSKKAT